MLREDIIKTCSQYSMLSQERLNNNINAVEYVERQRLAGDVVEVGVWKGGSMLAMMLAYEKTKHLSRRFHLYDTFEGMTAATEADKDHTNADATQLMNTNPFIRCIGPLDEVKANLGRHTSIQPLYHVGDIMKNTYYPEKIAVLRLDTDWYESTKFELDNFYDKVVSGGVIIIDDYGHWKGCKKAVDEFLATRPQIMTYKIDYTGIYFIKP